MLRTVARTANHVDGLLTRNSSNVAGPSTRRDLISELFSGRNTAPPVVVDKVKPAISSHEDRMKRIRDWTNHRPPLTSPSSRVSKRVKDGDNAERTRRRWTGPRPSLLNAPSLPPRIPLRPARLSQMVKDLCERGGLDSAIELVQNTPLDAQNTIVWATLMSEALRTHRFNVAYKLYIDMKRRGHKPTTSTFLTMFNGLLAIKDWEKHTKQLENSHTLYEDFIRHIQAVRLQNPTSPEIRCDPIALYMKILASANLHQKIFDTFNEMEQDGPMAPNERIFSVMFNALSWRKVTEKTDGLSLAAQNASDAKLLWRQMLKLVNKGLFSVDSYIIHPAIRILGRGRSTDQAFAFEIVREYLGLARPDETPLASTPRLSGFALQAVLELYNITQKHRLCVRYVQQLMADSQPLDHKHMEQLLIAYISLTGMGALSEPRQAVEALKWMLRQDVTWNAGPPIRPRVSTYNLALMVCSRGGDWAAALEAFELMTGCRAADLHDSAAGRRSQASHISSKADRSPGRALLPDAQTLSCMASAAWATHVRANMRQYLRIAGSFGSAVFSTSQAEQVHPAQAYYYSKLAGTLAKMVHHVVSESAAEGDAQSWRTLEEQAREFSRTVADSAVTPALEKQTFGSQLRLDKMQEAIDFEMVLRASMPR